MYSPTGPSHGSRSQSGIEWYTNRRLGIGLLRVSASIAARLLRWVSTHTSWNLAACVAHRHPTLASEPRPGSHTNADSNTFIGHLAQSESRWPRRWTGLRP